MIYSNEVYSVQSYLELVTGRCYTTHHSFATDEEFIEDVLLTEVKKVALKDIDKLQKDKNYVLVQCLHFDDENEDCQTVYVWFELTKNSKCFE